jgi:hypothetical protein
MSYQFARIDLSKTQYQATVEWGYLIPTDEQMQELDNIYRTYCTYKKFTSVMPMFRSRYTDPSTDVIGYFDQGQMVAFSLIRRFDEKNALCDQFAWTYHDPKLRMGIETMKTECAIYKARGFDYLYLEQAQTYKKEIDGFELLGTMT